MATANRNDEGEAQHANADDLIRRGGLAHANGELDEAESLLTRALAVVDRAGGDDGDLPLLLNELIRLHLKQSAYALAEPLLLRLLDIKRRQHGEGAPEVATVLASLASVRQGLGDHGSAEELYRQALFIREERLPPNHIGTAATMESLAESCAARGHFSEALPLLTRALAMREATLGVVDPSVRAARERISDLQLQSPEESAPLHLVRSTPSSSPVFAEPDRGRIVGASRLPMVLVPYASELASMEEEMDGAEPGALTAPARISAAVRARLQNRSATAAVTVVGALLVVAAFGFTSRVRERPAASAFVIAEPYNPGTRRDTTMPVAIASPQPATPVAAIAAAFVAPRATAVTRSTPEPRRQEPAAAFAPQQQGLNLPRDIVPSLRVPEITTASTSASLPLRTFTDSFPDRLSGLGREGGARGADADRAPTAPRLLGTAPQPKYPDRLRDLRVEGEVLLQFTVGENGRADVASVNVVRSPHPLLSDAVRAVLPQFRFEPARTAGADPRPRAETVKYAFTFHAP